MSTWSPYIKTMIAAVSLQKPVNRTYANFIIAISFSFNLLVSMCTKLASENSNVKTAENHNWHWHSNFIYQKVDNISQSMSFRDDSKPHRRGIFLQNWYSSRAQGKKKNWRIVLWLSRHKIVEDVSLSRLRMTRQDWTRRLSKCFRMPPFAGMIFPPNVPPFFATTAAELLASVGVICCTCDDLGI